MAAIFPELNLHPCIIKNVQVRRVGHPPNPRTLGPGLEEVVEHHKIKSLRRRRRLPTDHQPPAPRAATPTTGAEGSHTNHRRQGQPHQPPAPRAATTHQPAPKAATGRQGQPPDRTFYFGVEFYFRVEVFLLQASCRLLRAAAGPTFVPPLARHRCLYK